MNIKRDHLLGEHNSALCYQGGTESIGAGMLSPAGSNEPLPSGWMDCLFLGRAGALDPTWISES